MRCDKDGTLKVIQKQVNKVHICFFLFFRIIAILYFSGFFFLIFLLNKCKGKCLFMRISETVKNLNQMQQDKKLMVEFQIMHKG